VVLDVLQGGVQPIGEFGSRVGLLEQRAVGSSARLRRERVEHLVGVFLA
jgi:hypothetical protein